MILKFRENLKKAVGLIAKDIWTGVPYADWLEETIREMVEVSPESIALEMLTADGRLYTCYYNVSQDDRARMMSAMRDDDRMEWVFNNRDMILEALNAEDEEEDEEWNTEV